MTSCNRMQCTLRPSYQSVLLCLPRPITNELELFFREVSLKLLAGLQSRSSHGLEARVHSTLRDISQEGVEALLLLGRRWEAGAPVDELLCRGEGVVVPAGHTTRVLVNEVLEPRVRDGAVDPCVLLEA